MSVNTALKGSVRYSIDEAPRKAIWRQACTVVYYETTKLIDRGRVWTEVFLLQGAAAVRE